VRVLAASIAQATARLKGAVNVLVLVLVPPFELGALPPYERSKHRCLGISMLDPKTMWTAIAAFALVIVGWKAFAPRPEAVSDEAFAVVAVGHGADQRLEKVTQAQCTGDRLWISHGEGHDCLVYVQPSSATRGDTATDTAVVFIDGDVPDAEMNHSGDERMRATYKRVVDEFSAKFGLPLFVLARPGVLGSSGVHKPGGRREDVPAIDSGLTALKSRFGIRRLVLAGQSGGARMIAQLLVTGRGDVVCGVMGSGAYDVPRLTSGGRTATDIFGDPGRRFVVPMLRASEIQAQSSRRLFLVGDRRDKVTPFDEQQAFAMKLNQLGHHAVLVETEARDERFHGVSRQSIEAAGQCAKGASDGDVAAAAGKLVTLSKP
jgi:predicted esterase